MGIPKGKLPTVVQSPKNTPVKGVIHMIVGGPTDGDSRGAQSAHARAARTIVEINHKMSVGDPMIHFWHADA
ncbi:UNVERIFIED_CONTAM: hypothetical protein Sradi_1757900 [Sesamum radiatum]|uniref:Uncharacterized protein n=1 Tax=Sesamum radiatum TaxID=300843 RepID=A0AAW2TTE1_SESRA